MLIMMLDSADLTRICYGTYDVREVDEAMMSMVVKRAITHAA